MKNRRKFIKEATLVAGLLPLWPDLSILSGTKKKSSLKVHIFSKHLHFLDYTKMAEAAAQAGFDGVDLTVRPRGHVLPENVGKDLPRAVKAIQAAGMKSIIMATEVTSAADSTDRKVLETAAEQGISHYRSAHFSYKKDRTIPESIAFYQLRLQELGKLNKDLGIVGCYQNHAGTQMGASIWELYDLLEESPHDTMGAQYDIRHATVEGGLSWSRGLELIQPRIQSIVIKDFKWGQVDGRWRPVDVPFGEGMVDFESYFKLLKSYNIDVPVSLHMEYPLGGAEKGQTEIGVAPEVVFAAMKRDLEGVRRLWASV